MGPIFTGFAMIFDMAGSDLIPQRFALLLTGVLLTAFTASGCGKKALSREQYVHLRILATLRAREKGTGPEEELGILLGSSGISKEVFDETRVRWFCRGTFQEIRQGLRAVLDTPDLLSRQDYIQYRVRVFLRSRIRGTPFGGELEALAKARGFTVRSFRTAEEIWRGDEETDREIDETYAGLAGARAVPWNSWVEVTSRPEWSAMDGEGWLQRELERRGIDREDWIAAEDLHRMWEQDEK
jgi:hypothetical protein